jgi:hypothetical protein
VKRRRPGSSEKPGSLPDPEPADVIDPVRWQILSEMIIAASRGDKDEVHKAIMRMAKEVPDDGVAGTYLWFLIQYHVAKLLGHQPTADELHQLADDISARFLRAVPAARTDQSILERALRTVFDLAAEEEQVAGGRIVVVGAAALGVMLDDPSAQLESMRPLLAEWWRRYQDDFREQGLLDEIRRR